MLLRIVIRINIVRCISVNKIEITVLSARVLDALSGRGLKAKTVHEFERYGTRRIVKHCLGKGQILYSKETVQNFVWQERAKQESGTLPHYQWGITQFISTKWRSMEKFRMNLYGLGRLNTTHCFKPFPVIRAIP